MVESRQRRILIVDDDAEVRRTVSTMLTALGFEVKAVDGANAALAHIEGDRPDAILTDIHMAEGDGFELLNAVRDIGLDIPVIVMSGGSGTFGTDHLGFAQKLGAAAVVDKPFRSAQLAAAIEKVLEGRPAEPRET